MVNKLVVTPNRWTLPGLWAAVTVAVAALPWFDVPNVWTRHILLIAVMALLVSGLNLSLGWAGEFNMGLPAMAAAGAYVTAYIATRIYNDLLVSLLLGALAAVVVGLLAGAPGLRLGGWMLAVCTFMLVTLIGPTLQIIPFEILGGQSGFTGIPRPEIFGYTLGRAHYYVAVIMVTSLWFAVYRNAVRSPYGNSLLVLQHGPVLAPSVGLSRGSLKLRTYAFASIPVGLAGTFMAYTDRFIAPESLGLHLMMTAIVVSIVAGRRSIYAIFLGATLVHFIDTESTRFGAYADVMFGVFLIIGGILLGGGISGLVHRLAGRWRPAAPAAAVDPAADTRIPPLPGKDLRLESVSKEFGGVRAVHEVSLVARRGQITALIGPNGSGKTTTLNLINGFQKPDGGRILIGDDDVTGFSAVQIARRGVARTFQTPAIPIELSVLDVVASSRIQAHHASLLATILRLPRYRRIVAANRAAAARWLHILGLDSVAHEPAAAMALGTRRMVELARALASEPAVLLLDEVASGLDRHEVRELAAVLRRVRDAGATVILVEHNFSLVRSLADHVVVLAEGSVLTAGTPQEIAEHPEVLERFLGSGAGVSGTTVDESTVNESTVDEATVQPHEPATTDQKGARV